MSLRVVLIVEVLFYFALCSRLGGDSWQWRKEVDLGVERKLAVTPEEEVITGTYQS